MIANVTDDLVSICGEFEVSIAVITCQKLSGLALLFVQTLLSSSKKSPIQLGRDARADERMEERTEHGL